MRKPSKPLPDTLLALCLEGIHRSTTPEQLETTKADLAEIRNANPDFDWRPVYRAFNQRRHALCPAPPVSTASAAAGASE
jgi:hypothetical protein